MRILTLAFLILASASSCLFADAASKDAKIEEFLVLIKANAMQDQIYAQLTQEIDRATLTIAQQGGVPVPEQRSATADLQAKMMAAMKEAMSWEKLQPGLVEAYRSAYSEEQLDGILAFFKGPIGRAYIANSPAIATKYREIEDSKLKVLGTELQTMGKEWLAQHPKPLALEPVPR